MNLIELYKKSNKRDKKKIKHELKLYYTYGAIALILIFAGIFLSLMGMGATRVNGVLIPPNPVLSVFGGISIAIAMVCILLCAVKHFTFFFPRMYKK